MTLASPSHSSDTSEERLITVGRLGKVYGVHGWLTVHSFTEETEQLFDYQPWLIGNPGKWQDLTIIGIEHTAKHDLVQFEGFVSPEQSRKLTGLWLAVPRTRLPSLPPGEYYWDDLKGLTVLTENGETLGTVDDVFETGAHPILSIKGHKQHLIPFVQGEIVSLVDLTQGKLVAKWDPNF